MGFATSAFGAPTQSQNDATPDVNNSLAGKGGAGGGGGVGTPATGSNQPAPFGVPAGLGNPTVGATPAPSGGGGGKFSGILGDIANQVGQAAQQQQPIGQATPAPQDGGFGKAGALPIGPTQQVGAATPGQPAGGMFGKGAPSTTIGASDTGPTSQWNPVLQNPIGAPAQQGAPRGFNQFAPTPAQRAAISGAGHQPQGIRGGVVTAGPQPVAPRPVNTGAPQFQPNFRTGGLMRGGPARLR